MELEGKVCKSQGQWLAEVPSLNLMTQSCSKEGALDMVYDLLMEYTGFYFKSKVPKKFDLEVTLYEKGILGFG